jgi:4-hydroxy-3-polyprenylbenzoate decarboxylase
MGYRNLAHCIRDLESSGQLIRIDQEVDPYLEVGSIQRRVFQVGGPAVLFSRVKGSAFPMLGNQFGTPDRIRFMFQDGLTVFQEMIRAKEDPRSLLRHPLRVLKGGRALWNSRPRRVKRGPLLSTTPRVSALPQLVSWPLDGGSYITLPQVYSENPRRPGFKASNLGMYRIQMSGNRFAPDREVGLHYQIHRGIGHHHVQALRQKKSLPVNIFVGGPPSMTLAAIMPLPEGVPEIFFAGLLGGRRVDVLGLENGLIAPAEADFCLSGTVHPHHELPEGPFGDHLGYYSLTHDFPVMTVDRVYARKDAVWPFTTVGRPPQEDSVIGDFIHELVGPLVPSVFQGIHEVHAVDQAGVHPLLLAVGSERYVPFAGERVPQELLTNAHALLGSTQTALSKYVFIAAREDDSRLSAHHVPDFFQHVLARVDWSRDLHFLTRTTMDTLDYTGISLNQGSKVIVAAAGPPKRELQTALPAVNWPAGFTAPVVFAPGILILQGPAHTLGRDEQDPGIEGLCRVLESGDDLQGIALLVLVDDSHFTARSWDNFLWVTFTRSDPATDSYGLQAFWHCKHWGCGSTLVLDARHKSHQAPVLEPDPAVEKRVDALGAPGGPLHGII